MSKIGYYIFIIGSLLLVSCNQKKQAIKLSIPEQELLDIMVDLTIAQAAVTNYASSQKDSMRNVYKYQLEEIHGMPMGKIDSILNIIYNDPELNKKLQKQVLDSLKILEEKTNKVK